ncbi:MAG: hypothetical protein GX559_03825 [Candidatus Pacebacteria bacterium]|nr:hypothetical protein [Candidatus Paceibacterota bacterium]
MNKERGENLGNPIVEVKFIAPKASSIEDEELLNRIIFDFNLQVPGAVHTTEDLTTPDTPEPYCLKVMVDQKHLEAFKNYVTKETEKERNLGLTFC